MNKVEKILVRRKLADYENKLKNEMRDISNRIEEMNKVCSTSEMNTIWHQSKEYALLMDRLDTLSRVKMDITEIRCSDLLEDKE